MGYRIVEISRPAEFHINKGLLSIEQQEGTACIPIEDIATLVFHGPAIRISTNTEQKPHIQNLENFLSRMDILKFSH